MLLPRSSTRPRFAAARLAHVRNPRARGRRQPCQALAGHWLNATGSLTARLRGLGDVSVKRLRQQALPLWPLERALLGMPHGHVREVLLIVSGEPAVWARSITSGRAVKGAWRALKGLGNRPLAELLFTDRSVRRAPLDAARLHRRGPGARLRARAWLATHSDAHDRELPQWMRWSLFERRGQRLLVQEAFAPWVLTRQLPPPRR